jgi:hypothetical protein
VAHSRLNFNSPSFPPNSADRLLPVAPTTSMLSRNLTAGHGSKLAGLHAAILTVAIIKGFLAMTPSESPHQSSWLTVAWLQAQYPQMVLARKLLGAEELARPTSETPLPVAENDSDGNHQPCSRRGLFPASFRVTANDRVSTWASAFVQIDISGDGFRAHRFAVVPSFVG